MSIETEINRISTNVSNTLSAISEMGGEVPEGATSNDMASGVRSIPVGAKIDDTTPSTSTTYSSSKIESELTALNDANAALIEVSKTEPSAENTELWIHPNADEVQLPQINDSVESVQDTWSSKKIAAEVSKKANDADLAVVAKSGSYNDLANKPTIPTVPSTLPNPNALTFTGAVNETYDGSAAKSVAIPSAPESLKNPNKLILSGAVTAEYDGSAEVSVEIPAGGGGGESEFAGTEKLLASGTIPSGTAAMSITDSGVTYDELLKHRYVKVTFKSTENNYPEYSFRENPSAAWHLNGIGSYEVSGHFTIFEPVGKLLRPAMKFSSGYSTLGNNGFEIGNYNIDPRSALISYDRWHAYQGSDTMKFAFASKATTADWNWWIYALD